MTIESINSTRASAPRDWMLNVSSLREEEALIPTIRTIRYLGNKRRLLPFICEKVREHVTEGRTVLDLFGGTNCVSYALKPNYRILTNDIQLYSQIISKALIVDGRDALSRAEIEPDLLESYSRNYESLKEVFGDFVQTEEMLLRESDETSFAEYAAFCEAYPYYESALKRDGKFPRMIAHEIALRQEKPSLFPYMLFSSYFATGYFSLEQCLQIDSLRYAIDATQRGQRKYMCLAALIYSIDQCVSSTGHFAQYRKIRDASSHREISCERTKSVGDKFYDMIVELFSEPKSTPFNNQALCFDYRVLLRDLISRKDSEQVALIYADPPFTKDHYSRFYHVLET